MASSISFGSVNTIGGKTVLTGSQSGIDTNALVTALTTAKALPATQAQTKITANQAKIAALTSLKTALSTLQTSVDSLRNPSFGSSTANAFAARTPFLTVTNGHTVADYIGVTTAPGAPIGKYTIQVDHLASAESRQSSAFASRSASVVNAGGTNTPNAFAAGTFQINGSNVTINENDSLNNVAAAINSVSSTSKVTASIVKLSDSDFRLVLNAKDTGAASGITITDASHVLPYDPLDVDPAHENTASSPGNTNSMFAITKSAVDSQIQFNNQTVTRPNNSISDLIDNVTFSLYGKTNGETLTLDIDKNNASVATSVGNFVDAYNAIRTFQAQQNQRDTEGNLVKTAVLANDSTLNTVMNQISALVAGQASIAIPSLNSSGISYTPIRMGDVGINLDNIAAGTDANGDATPAVTNTLTLDPSKLNTNLESFFDNVSKIFQYNFTASSANIGIYKRDNTVTNANFNIVIDNTQPMGQQALITSIDGAALTTPISLNYSVVGGKTVISGAPGTDLAGFNFTYSGSGNETLQRTSGLTSKSLTLTVDTTQPDASKALVTKIFGATLATPIAMKYTASAGTASINGLAGTPFAGLQMVYSGPGNETINIGMNQGIADKMYNSLNGIVNGLGSASNSVGLIDDAIKQLQDSDNTLQKSIDTINGQVSTYRDQLLAKFAALEAAISASNQLLQLLSAQTNAALVNSGH